MARRTRKPTQLSQKQWAALWITEGGNPAKAQLASAVVMAESGGKVSIYNGICCHGGYQFNTNTLSVKCANNPICATKAAISHSNNGEDWSIWEGYTNGSYQNYMSTPVSFSPGDIFGEALKLVSPLYRLFHGEAPLPKFPGQGQAVHAGEDVLKTDAGALGIDLGPFFAIPAFFKGFGELVLTPEGWLRLAKLLGGSIFVLWGLRIVIRESTGSDPVKGVTKAAEAAAVVAAVK